MLATVEPWLRPGARVLEIGPGGGKWTVRLAPRVGQLVVSTSRRPCWSARGRASRPTGVPNVSFVLGDGLGLTGIADQSLDVVFSYDVFVHIAPEDTVAYLDEIARVLAPGGVAVIHHAVAESAAALDRMESHNDWYRDRANTLGQYYYYSRDGLTRAYERRGFEVVGTWSFYCTAVYTVRKPTESVVPAFERAIRRAAIAETPEALEAAARDAAQALAEAQRRLATLTAELSGTRPGLRRYDVLQRMRRLIRG